MSASAALPIGVGIIGLGRAGWSLHALTLESMSEQYRVAAVCDPEESRRAEAKARFGCAAYTEVGDLVNDPNVELVVVASPSHLHAPYAIAAMKAGKDALVEKPFATSLVDVDAMIRIGQQTGRIVTASQNYRYGPDFMKVREVVESGALGTVLFARFAWHGFSRRWDWQTLKEYGGGSLNNSASHAVDQALLLLGDVEPHVACQMVSTPLSSGDAEDHVKITLSAPGSPWIDIEISSAVAYGQDRWLVAGTQGGLTGTTSRIRWKYIDISTLPPRPVSRVPTPDRSYNREELTWTEETYDCASEPFRSSNERLYADLYRTIRDGVPLAIAPESVRRQIAVLEKCRELASV
ncbi:Gfo/Idh/MocA family oxidoreductase [Candidatus Poribacteria bacterium]|nr:Gfo/Idh/MocA family oxidoreductase [Candidatus Poribacteria bacterium]